MFSIVLKVSQNERRKTVPGRRLAIKTTCFYLKNERIPTKTNEMIMLRATYKILRDILTEANFGITTAISCFGIPSVKIGKNIKRYIHP